MGEGNIAKNWKMKKTIVDSFSEKLMGRTLIGPEISPLSCINNTKPPVLSKLINCNSPPFQWEVPKLRSDQLSLQNHTS